MIELQTAQSVHEKTDEKDVSLIREVARDPH